jgi:hypothetical protein
MLFCVGLKRVLQSKSASALIADNLKFTAERGYELNKVGGFNYESHWLLGHPNVSRMIGKIGMRDDVQTIVKGGLGIGFLHCASRIGGTPPVICALNPHPRSCLKGGLQDNLNGPEMQMTVCANSSGKNSSESR